MDAVSGGPSRHEQSSPKGSGEARRSNEGVKRELVGRLVRHCKRRSMPTDGISGSERADREKNAVECRGIGCHPACSTGRRHEGSRLSYQPMFSTLTVPAFIKGDGR